ncbi:hypothetical protein H0Z60_01735 [Ectothiorhodospiraceae bacterium WFHF3C12]|nr:hypothetical protein [Ectothiorhodospiraceae bacterium WFHF3C12]
MAMLPGTWTGRIALAAVAGLAVGFAAWMFLPGEEARRAAPAVADEPKTERKAEDRSWPAFDVLLGGERGPARPESGDSPRPDREKAPDAPRAILVLGQALDRLAFDEHGKLVVDKAAGQALEEALAGLERPLTERELDDMALALRRRLDGAAAEQVIDLVRDYQAYTQALAAREARSRPRAAGSARTRFDELVALRRRHLGADVATRVYADEEAYRRFVLERQRIASRTDLSQQQRVALQTALQDDLLRGVMHLRGRDTPEARQLRSEMRMLREQGASQAFRDFVRSQALGLAAAGDAIESEEDRAAWQRQLALYRSERQAILEAGLTEADKREQLEALLGRYFGERERSLAEAFRED